MNYRSLRTTISSIIIGLTLAWHAQPLHENSGGSGDHNIQSGVKWNNSIKPLIIILIITGSPIKSQGQLDVMWEFCVAIQV